YSSFRDQFPYQNIQLHAFSAVFPDQGCQNEEVFLPASNEANPVHPNPPIHKSQTDSAPYKWQCALDPAFLLCQILFYLALTPEHLLRTERCSCLLVFCQYYALVLPKAHSRTFLIPDLFLSFIL